MAVIKEVTVTAKTVQDAFEQGKIQLNLSETDDVAFEIIQQESKKLFRSLPAIVRVYVEGPDPVAAPQEKPVKPAAKKAAPAKKENKPVSKPAAVKPEQPAAQEKEAAPMEESANPLVPVTEAEYSEKVQKALSLLKQILAQMDLGNLTFSVAQNENEAQINVTGEDASYLIGRRGETMSALQYLISLSVNRKEDAYYRIMLNVEHYREKREKTLAALATRMAKYVIRSGRSTTLEPMNPYERRIIHATVQRIDGAVSSSIGEEPNRRVVIKSANGRPQHSGGDRDRYKGGARGGHGNGGRRPEHKERQYVAPRDENGEKRAPKSDLDFGDLYGKIEL